jgi:hypothetical protein
MFFLQCEFFDREKQSRGKWRERKHDWTIHLETQVY